ncbi:MAG: MFS transporter [bacterium]
MGKWKAIVAISLAQFVMVLDTTVMNVSLEQVVRDLDSTISQLQVAITFYTLTMAALMLTGGRLGGIWGRLNTYRIGLVVYGVGSLITALAPSFEVLFLGWSIVEALGAVLIIPATVALTSSNYKGRDRAIAFGLLGGISAAGAAAGPLIGGLVTEYASWRYVFAAESVIMVGLLLTASAIKDAPKSADESLDRPSVALSAFGLGLIVYGVLRASVWGWITPEPGEPSLLGLSLVPWLVSFGLLVLGVFLRRQLSLERDGRKPLLPSSLIKIAQLRGGLMMLVVQQLLLAGTFFVIPVYLQIVLGKSSLETGLRILPLALGVMAASMIGARLSERFSPRQIVRVGLGILFVGIVTILGSVNAKLDSGLFIAGMAIFGIGVGAGISQLGNTIMSAAPQKHASEAGGLQGTASNLGMSLGTALIGAVLLTGLNAALVDNIQNDPRISQQVKNEVSSATAMAPVITQEQAKQELAKSGLTESEQVAALDDYETSLISALRQALFVAAFLALISIWFVRLLPDRPLVAARGSRAPPPRVKRKPA